MKKIITCFIALLTFSAFCQVPENDLLENAITLNTFPYNHNNLRLDLATSSSISPNGCPLGNYNLVYYKFTAEESSEFEVTVEDANNNDIITSFAIIFTAPSLNITDDSELNIVTACSFGANTSFTTIAGQNYYVLVHRGDANETSNIIFQQEAITPISSTERSALIAIYNSTNGSDWTTSTNWNSTNPVGTWHGVTTSNVNGTTHVTSIDLGGNNLTGTLPSEIGNFPELTWLGLWGNQISGEVPPEIGNLTSLTGLDLSPNTFSGTIPEEIGNLVNLQILWLNHNGLTGSIPSSFENLINLRELYLIGAVGNSSEWSSSSYSGDFPDLTAAPLEILRIQDNFFTFNDIADEYDTYVANIPDFQFNPQFTLDPPEEPSIDVGENITLSITDTPSTSRNASRSLSTNNYQWFKDDVAIPDTNATTYVITNAQGPDSGIYYCEITNPDLPGYVVKRSNITLDVGGFLSVDEATFNNSVSIFPNPTSDYIYIELPKNNTNTHISIHNILGKKVTELDTTTNQIKLNVSHYSQGIYLVSITNNNNTYIKKIIKK